jgi:hypothetical protein
VDLANNSEGYDDAISREYIRKVNRKKFIEYKRGSSKRGDLNIKWRVLFHIDLAFFSEWKASAFPCIINKVTVTATDVEQLYRNSDTPYQQTRSTPRGHHV